jgi:imidazole glycerol-phosphate synthase subunit HisF
MLTKRIIPCLDCDLSVPKGRVVKGVKFKEIQYAGDPIELATRYSDEGADEIVFLDITASSDKRTTMLDVIEQTTGSVFVPVTVGGGIRSVEDIQAALKAGADKVSMNTAAIKNPQLIRAGASRFGEQCIVVAIDAKRNGDSWNVWIYGGREDTGIDAIEWAKKAESLGAGEILLTSMDRDGVKNGYDIELTRTISEALSIPIIASGGAGEPKHLLEAFDKGKADAALAASIFHFDQYPIREVKEYLSSNGVPMRL